MIGPLGFWNQLQKYQFQTLCANGLKPNHRLLDLGCGPLQGGVAFIRYLEPSKYTGIDNDPARIEAARGQIARHRLSSKVPSLLISSTFGDRELHETFDFVWASQILYIFETETMATLLACVRKRLRPGGKFLGDILGPRHYLFRFPEAKYVLHTVESLQHLAAEHGLRVRSLGEIAQYGYPRRLSLHSNLLVEFTLTE
jgi:cyclopropane fatty-acyl-phospholipid synthase-like methyltransferase